jgi:hypothetical protein
VPAFTGGDVQRCRPSLAKRFRLNPLQKKAGTKHLALPKVRFKLLKDFAALDVNEAKADRLWRPSGFPSRADRRSRIPRRNLDIVKRFELSKVANAESLTLARHSKCAHAIVIGACLAVH